MTDLRELARPHLDAAARFTPELVDLQRRATALRRRRRILTSVGLFGVVGVCAAVVLVASNRPTTLDTAGGGPGADGAALTIQRVEARGGPSGTSEVIVVFDAPLPIDDVPRTDTVEDIDPGSLVAAVQDPGPGAVEVCGAKHWFPEVPDGSGSVDLLIPANWLAGDPPVLPTVTPLEPAPDKIVLCGPYGGHVQISIWGAAPTSTETLDLTLSGDRTRITLRVISSNDAQCVASGDPTITVPDVVGRPLAEAIERVTDDGLAVVGRGVPEADPGLDSAIVRAQEPPAGELVPAGACVGFRTQAPVSSDAGALVERAEADPEEYEPPSHPTLAIAPSDGLVDGQVIAVLGEGLPPGEYISIPACVVRDSPSPTGPKCLHTSSGVGTVDAQGRLWFPAYKLAAFEPAIGFNCAEPPGCELAWYVGHGEPARVSAPINVTE